jgi:ABC-type dipeptide/oligopeptide/nickel transport system permease subunit
VYVTPVAILLILVISAVRLLDPSPRVRFAYSVLLPLVAVTLLVWPAEAVARIMRHFSQLQILGEGTMRLTWWWWTYCVSLALVMTFGIIELGAILRNYLKQRTKGSLAHR